MSKRAKMIRQLLSTRWNARGIRLSIGVTVGLFLLCGSHPLRAAQGDADNSVAVKTKGNAADSAQKTRRSPSAEEIQLLEEMRDRDLKLFIERSGDFIGTVDQIIARRYEMRRRFIEERYAAKIRAEEALELQALRDAIEYFEAFLKKYPADPPYTPDAMFRLAELYYDVSYIDYLEGLTRYEEAQNRGDSRAQMPEKEFNRSIALFEKLIEKYPDYQHVDGAYYLLGYCLNETGRLEEARLAWLNLVCPNKFVYDPAAWKASLAPVPDSPYHPSESLKTEAPPVAEVPFVDPFAECRPVTKNTRFFFEAWWLIGNYHFDFDTSKYGVETAMAAYQKLATDPSHKFYDKGLYKLAWSYFKADRYPEAIRSFARVVDFSDENKSGESGMRPEAIQYLAVCFFTDDWNVDMNPDEGAGIPRLQDPTLMPQDRPWTREVYARLGEIYAENEKNDEAIAVWRLYLSNWPNDIDAPFVQDRIANAFREMRRYDEELAERSRLGNYGPGSSWWEASADYPETQNRVAALARDALINSAVMHHQQAQALRARAQVIQDAEILQFALEEYGFAADAYRKYLTMNPDSPDAYDLNFQLADALFWSGRYEEARTEYVAVRDSNMDNEHREDSARMVIICLEKIMSREIESGRLTVRESPPPLEGTPPAPKPEPIPPVLLELMNEREAFLQREPYSADAPTFDYQSAQNYYRYGHWDEARSRYEVIYNKYCQKDEISIFSWKTLLNIAVDQSNLDEKERLALLEQKKQCGSGLSSGDADSGIDLGSLLGDVAMQRAMTRFSECVEGKDQAVCTDAGDQLVAAVAKAPGHQSADAALHNAALAYENAQRFETAMTLYGRIVNEYPKSRWVDKCLFKQAFAANAFFEYEQALSLYRILADEKRFAQSEYREDAIINAALILTNLQSYKAAILYWKRYSDEVDDPKKSIEAAFNAADMYFRSKDYYDASKAYETFILKYQRNPEAGPFVVKASYRTGLCLRKRGKPVAEARQWEETIEFYNRLVNEPGSMSAEYAAESHFLLVEQDMRNFEKFEIKGSQKQIEEKLKAGAEKVKDFETRYRLVQKYRRPEWSLAAEFRIGYAFEVYSRAILAIPPPPLDPELQKALRQLPAEDREAVMLDYEDKFRAAMEQRVAAVEERAQAEYRIAVSLSRDGNISNDWTLLAIERMNAYDPEGFPRQHNGAVALEELTTTVPAWAPEVTP